MEKEAQQMLFKATQHDPNNLIYRIVYLGNLTTGNKEQYKQVEIEAAPKVLETYKGSGSLNRYFREILYRISK